MSTRPAHTARIVLMIAALSSLLVACPGARPRPDGPERPEYGAFQGPIRTEWLADGREMVLLEDVVFRDARSTTWTAPAGALINGSSIPQAFWTFIGGPYEGRHRDASVIHDYKCCVKQRDWRAVHRVFFDAMMARGEERWRANLMYFAVYNFGPRWPEARAAITMEEGDIARLAEYLEANPDLSLGAIETLTPAQLRQLVATPSAETLRTYRLVPDKPIEPAVRTAPCMHTGLAPFPRTDSCLNCYGLGGQ